MKVTRTAIVIIILVVLILLLVNLFTLRPSIRSDEYLKNITLPPGFHIDVFADGLGGSPVSTPGPNPGPRVMEFVNGTLFVSIPTQGRVVALPDRNGNNRADAVITFADNLTNPHGLAYYKGWLYVAEENRVIRFKVENGDLVANNKPEIVVDNIPSGLHYTRTIRIANDSLYISVGSGCNVCIDNETWRAAITRCNIDGSNCSTYAKGLRNAVGMAFNPNTGELWATENGRDLLGNDIPPDEIDIIKQGGDYGWPICYGNKVHDTDFDKNVYIRDPCADTIAPEVELQAHSAPLGLVFYNGTMFPTEYRGNLLVAFHGSWNRATPTGYKIVRIKLDGPKPVVEDFATGWLQGTNVLGRPVDLIVASDGSLLVSDDNAGKIYRISYSG